MTATTLTDRYIDAAIRRLPERQRADIAGELRGLIDDQIDDRAAVGEQRDAAERAVLESLGDPARLAAEYRDRPLWLIGPRYYLAWAQVIRLLLWIVPLCTAFAVALGTTLANEPIVEIVWMTITATVSATVHVLFWTTVIFALIERFTPTSEDPVETWTVDTLPATQSSGATGVDTIVNIVLLIALGAAVVWDQVHGMMHLEGHWQPFTHPGLWPTWVIGLLLVLAAEVVVSLLVFRRGGWNMPLAHVATVLNVAVGVGAVWLLAQGRLVNDTLTRLIETEAGPDVARILAILAGAIFIGVAVGSTVDAYAKARRAR